MMGKLFGRMTGIRKLFAVSLALSMAGGALIILEASSIADIVNKGFLRGQGLPSLWSAQMLLFGWILLRVLAHWAGEYSSAQMALGMKKELRDRLVRKLAELGPNYAKGERSGELVRTVTEAAEQLEGYLARYIPQMASSMFIPLAVFVMLAGLDRLSAIVLAVTMPLLVLFMILVGKTAKAKADRQFRTLGRLAGHFLDVLRGLPTLTIFNRSKAQIGIIGRISEEYRRTTMGTLRLAFLSAFVMELFATLSTAIVAVFLGLRLVEGQIGFEAAFLVLLLTPEFYAPVRALGSQFHASANGVSAAERIFAILDSEPPGWPERSDGVRLPERAEGYRIVFDRVSVRYPGEDRDALTEVSLVLEPGERIAVVGPTGAGKSTLLDLLQGYVRPSAGRITVDGVGMDELSMAWWRGQLAVLSQRVRLAPVTVAENIRLGAPDAALEDVLAAARAAQADGWIRAMPRGYDTPLGEAARLSGGQAQRLALARALLRSAPVTLLDEPTSGLDRASEAAVREALGTRLAGRMTVTVAHRLESVRDADRIVVLAGGRVAECGTPDELLAAGGLYAAMAGADDMNPRGGLIPAKRACPSKVNPKNGLNPDLEADLVQPIHTESSQPEPSIRGGDVVRGMMAFLRPYPWRVLLAVFLAFGTIAANVGLMGTSGYLIARAALRPETVLLLWMPIVGVRFFGIARGVLRYLERLASHDLTFRVLHRIRVWLFERVEPRGAVLLEERRSGDLLSSIIGDVEQLQNLYLRVVAPPTVAALTALLGFVVLSMIHISLGAVLLLMMAIAGVAIPWISRRLGDKPGREYVQAKGKLYTETAELIASLPEWTVFGHLPAALHRIACVAGETDSCQTKQNRIAASTSAAMVAATRLTMWVILGMSVYLAATGLISGVYIAALVVMVFACFEAVIPLPAAFQYMGQTMAAAKRLFQLTTDNQSEPTNPTEPTYPTEPEQTEPTKMTEPITNQHENLSEITPVPNTPNWHIDIQNLSYRYSPTEPFVINNLSLELKPGRKVAIVGESGAGKSTLLQLLLKLRPYQEGSILLNGAELRSLPAEFVRDGISVVSQSVQVFNATVADNLRLGAPHATLGEMQAAARLALISDPIDAMPQGYHTVIGEWGAKLSGGERQRLALARALLRPSKLVLFDEPSSGLDPLTERAFISNMNAQLRDKTVLWITHKLTGLERMDEIVVLRQGSVIERGTHSELLKHHGEYRRLWLLEGATAEKSTLQHIPTD